MKLEMITTGEEVLSGQIIDTNAAWFANRMLQEGVELQRRSTVGDRLPDLVSLLNERSREADVILMNGGLGPTTDDLTGEAVAHALGEDTVEHLDWRRHLEDWFHRRGREMPASNLKQCLLPRSAVLVNNATGSAPAFRVRLNDAWLFCTPGVPREFKHIVEESFLPFLDATFGQRVPVAVYKVQTLGYGESHLADTLQPLPIPPGITLGFRPSMPLVEIKLIARGESAMAALPGFADRVRATLGEAVVAENMDTLAAAVHNLLENQGLSLSIAESCTGGMLTSMLVDFPGSSSYLKQGLVTYAEEAKIKLLGVSPDTLKCHGAVSVATAREMARGVRALLDSDFALSVTGLAGPAGSAAEESGEETGTVVIGLADRQNTWIQKLHLSQRSRSLVRLLSSAVALDMLRRRVLHHEPLADYPMIRRSLAEVFSEQD